MSAEHAQMLRGGIPRTTLVSADNADALWREQKQLFFKPIARHGNKGVYRGSKLTKGTFARILESDYIALKRLTRTTTSDIVTPLINK